MTEPPNPAEPRDAAASDAAASDEATNDQPGRSETVAYSPPPETHPDWANPAVFVLALVAAAWPSIDLRLQHLSPFVRPVLL